MVNGSQTNNNSPMQLSGCILVVFIIVVVQYCSILKLSTYYIYNIIFLNCNIKK